jgi:hypothetical protein
MVPGESKGNEPDGWEKDERPIERCRIKCSDDVTVAKQEQGRRHEKSDPCNAEGRE